MADWVGYLVLIPLAIFGFGWLLASLPSDNKDGTGN